jgi:hypothetical protein
MNHQSNEQQPAPKDQILSLPLSAIERNLTLKFPANPVFTLQRAHRPG